MAELFIELFSEEIPAKLQIDARRKLKEIINEKLKKKEINFKSSKSFSTPTRLVFVIDGIPEKIKLSKKIIKGPNINAPQTALEGFIKSRNLKKSDVYKKKIDKGEFYFAEIKSGEIDVLKELSLIIPEAFRAYSWKKSMKWSFYEMVWGRPLKSIVCLLDNKIINFDYFHLKSGNTTLVNTINEYQSKKVSGYKSYLKILQSNDIILDQEKRKKIILNKMNRVCNSKKLKKYFNDKLVEEVVNLVDNPNVIIGKFNQIYLEVPQKY